MKKKICIQGAVVALMTALMTVPALAAPTGDVSGVIEQTWQSAATQIKTVVNSVVFPALDMILVVLLFVKSPVPTWITESMDRWSGRPLRSFSRDLSFL